MKNRFVRLTTVLLVLVCFGLLPQAQAVVPAPDGGYPGANTAEGANALLSLTAGHHNTAVGYISLKSDATGNYNTAIGAGALSANTADNNTATGYGALLSNTTGPFNTANGSLTLFHNTGYSNSAFGRAALYNNTTGNQNTANGFNALYSNTTGSGNTANGWEALSNNTTGSVNTANGWEALPNNTTGSDNIAVGDDAGFNVTTADSVICIGNHTGGANVSNSCFIGQIRGVTTQNNNAIPVLIDSAGQLGTASSSRRYKKEIKPMEQASEAILALKPVTFHYKSDKTNRPEFGLIAEQVAEVNPNLVVRDKNGEIYTVRYDAVNAMLLNEFLKEHRTVEEMKSSVRKQEAIMAQQHKDFEATISRLQEQIGALTATVKQQAAQIQNVSAQLEMSKPATQTVLNDR
jgi:hypothetical protein